MPFLINRINFRRYQPHETNVSAAQQQVWQQHHINNLVEKIQVSRPLLCRVRILLPFPREPSTCSDLTKQTNKTVLCCVGDVQEQSQTIVASTLRDEDGSLKEELEAMKGENAFGSFYSALKETKVVCQKEKGRRMTGVV